MSSRRSIARIAGGSVGISADSKRISPPRMASYVLGGSSYYWFEIPGEKDGSNTEFALPFALARDRLDHPICAPWFRGYVLSYTVEDPPPPFQFTVIRPATQFDDILVVGEPPEPGDKLYFMFAVPAFK